MAIAFLDKNRGFVSGATNTIVFNPGAGSNKILIVLLIQRAGALRTINSVTHNGRALTQAGTAIEETSTSVDLQITCWFLAGPDVGNYDLTATFSGSTGSEIIAVVYTGADQTSPYNKMTSDTSASGNNPSLTITPDQDGSLIIGGAVHEDVAAMTLNSGTSRYLTDQGAWSTACADIIQTTAQSGNINWTANSSLNYAAGTWVFKAVAADTTISVTDTGAGADSLAQLSVSLSLSDAGAGSDELSAAVDLVITDTGAGVELLNVLQATLILIADLGTGADAIDRVDVSLRIDESGSGVETVAQILANLMVTDLGSGVDVAVHFDLSTRIFRVVFTIARPVIAFAFSTCGIGFSLTQPSVEFALFQEA